MPFKKELASIKLKETPAPPPDSAKSKTSKTLAAQNTADDTKPPDGQPPVATWRATFKRAVAGTIDGAILFAPLAIFEIVRMTTYFNGKPDPFLPHAVPQIQLAIFLGYTAIICLARIPFISFALLPLLMLLVYPHATLALCVPVFFEAAFWLYYVLFETSAWRATIGKKVFGISVSDKHGHRIGFARASARHFLKSVSFLSASLPGIGLWLNSQQYLHDKISGCSVPGAPPIVPPPPPPLPDVEFAPLWRRACAAIIDAALIVSAELCIGSMIMRAALQIFQPTSIETLAVLVLILAPLCAISVLAPALVMAVFEWSYLQATPGKLIFGLKVISPTGTKVTLPSSLFKQFVQFALWLNMWPIAVVVAAVVRVFFNDAPYHVGLILVGSMLSFYGAMLCVTFAGVVKQSLADRIANRFVICSTPKTTSIITDQRRINWKALSIFASTMLTVGALVTWRACDLEPRESAAQRATLNLYMDAESQRAKQWTGGWLTASGKLVNPPDGMEVGSFSEGCATAKATIAMSSSKEN